VQELLEQIDPDYYRSARLLIVHAALEHLRQERQTSSDSGARQDSRLNGGPRQAGVMIPPGPGESTD
jgi:hypothetical protein